MAVEKLSVALDERVAAEARKAAEAAGMSLSAWLSHAAEERIAIEDGLRAVSEWEAEHGAITEEEKARAEEILRRHGII
ncbi:MAG: hypothetical protein GEV03_19895 [Streptosporangiales bacterium]|nr:hypothetical protein [Streptosporangiales bacterium]